MGINRCDRHKFLQQVLRPSQLQPVTAEGKVRRSIHDRSVRIFCSIVSFGLTAICAGGSSTSQPLGSFTTVLLLTWTNVTRSFLIRRWLLSWQCFAPLHSNLNQLTSVHTLITSLFYMHFNITLHFSSGIPGVSLIYIL